MARRRAVISGVSKSGPFRRFPDVLPTQATSPASSQPTKRLSHRSASSCRLSGSAESWSQLSPEGLNTGFQVFLILFSSLLVPQFPSVPRFRCSVHDYYRSTVKVQLGNHRAVIATSNSFTVHNGHPASHLGSHGIGKNVIDDALCTAIEDCGATNIGRQPFQPVLLSPGL